MYYITCTCACMYMYVHVCTRTCTMYIHTYWILFTCCVVVVCHPCHTLYHITTLSSLSLLYITHHSAHFTCYMYVHMHHTNVCSVLHMLTVCLDHTSSLHTCTVLVYHTYMYMYMYTYSTQCLSVVQHVPLFIHCHKTKNGSLVQAFRMCIVKRCYAWQAPFQWLSSR